ncbi:MAG: PAS domain S-box protein [Thermodesulfobacteriota bacterium]
MVGEGERRDGSDCVGVPLCFLVLDEKEELVLDAVNTAFEKASGLQGCELSGKRLSDIPGVPREAAERLEGLCRSCLALGQIRRLEEYLAIGGRQAWWMITLSPEAGGKEGKGRLCACWLDISESKEAESRLKVERDRFRALFEESFDAIFITSAGGKILEMNRRGVKLFGYDTKEEILSLDLARNVYADPEDRKRILEMVREKGCAEYDVAVKKKDGSLMLAHCRLSEIKGLGFPEPAYLGTLRDITGQRETEEALRRSNDMLQAIIDAAPVAIIGLDLDGKVRNVWNPAAERMLGWTSEEAMGRPLPSVPEKSREEFEGFRSRIKRNERLDGVEVRRLRKDGSPVDYSIYAAPFHEADGSISGNVAILVDIGDRKRVEEERRARLWFTESMNRVNQALQSTNDLVQMMGEVLDILLSLFGCDRASLVYPCDPEAAYWEAPMERTRPEYPGLYSQARECPMNPEVAGVFNALLAAGGPLRFGPGSPHSLPEEVAALFSIRSQMAMALYPKDDKPWMLVLHQCSYPREWTPNEVELFREAGRRLTDALSNLISYRRMCESERRLTFALEVGDTGVFEVDLVNGRGKWSSEIGEMWGLPEGFDGNLASFCWEHVHPEDLDRVKAEFDAIIASGKVGDMEFRIFRPDGRVRWVRWRGQVLKDAAGQRMAVGVNMDVTARREAEESLRRAEAEKSILNEIAAVLLSFPDQEMYAKVLSVVLRVLESPLGVFGYIAESGDLVIPSLTREVWEQCRIPGKSIVFPPSTWGDSLWGRAIREKTCLFAPGPFSTPAGHIAIQGFLSCPIVFRDEIIGLLSVANRQGGYGQEHRQLIERIADKISPILNARLQRDTEERRRREAEKALKESEEKYRLLWANADEAIFIVQDSVVKLPNQKGLQMTGMTAEELMSVPFTELVHPSDRDTVYEAYEKILQGERPSQLLHPFRIVDKKGKELWVHLTAAPVEWEGRPGGLCLLRDVTQEKNLEAHFLQAQKMEAVGRLAGGVAHDFNNMLSVINGFSELAMLSLHEGDPLQTHLKEISQAGERAAVLTRQLLAFSRKQMLALRIVDLNALLTGIEGMLRRLIGEDIDLVTMPAERLGMVKADPGQLEQVIMNLAVNARDAMPRGGRLILETANVDLDEEYAEAHVGAVAGPHIMLAVTDTGCGMDKKTMERVFEPFFTTKEQGKGTGLGLATVYGIVKQNGGSIWIYSEPSKGTTFKIYLPAVEEAAPDSLAAPAIAKKGQGQTILVVEDEEAVRKLIVHILEHSNYRTLQASNGGEALLLGEKHPGSIDLILTDVVMPQMGGRELAERLSGLRPGIKVLYMSGYTDKAVVKNGELKEGALFVQKPFRADDLLKKVWAVLAETA